MWKALWNLAVSVVKKLKFFDYVVLLCIISAIGFEAAQQDWIGATWVFFSLGMFFLYNAEKQLRERYELIAEDMLQALRRSTDILHKVNDAQKQQRMQ